MSNSVEYSDVTIETIDRAIRDWFDKTVNAQVRTTDDEAFKVPVQFSQGERWNVGRNQRGFRDENGVLVLPIIAIRRTGIDADPTKMALGVQTNNIQIAKLIDPKTNDIQNLEARKPGTVATSYPPIYEVYTIPFPDRLVAQYQVVIHTQFIGQMNDILQKMWRSLDIQKSFVAPLKNDGRHTPRSMQYGTGDPYNKVVPLSAPYVVGFMDTAASDSGNFEEFTDTERIVKYTTEIKVPFVLQTSSDQMAPTVSVERTAYKVVMKDENCTFVDNPEELDRIFGKLR